MKTLVVLAVVGVCSAVPFIQDTPEVAAEKARFFQAFQAAQQSATPQHHNFIPHQAHNPVHHHQTHHQVHHHMAHHQQAQFTPKWTGPVAATVPAGVNGAITPVGNTADVNAARQAFFNAYQAQLSATVGAAPSFPQAVPVHTPSHVPAHTFNPVHAGPVQPKWTGPVAATVPAGLPGSTSQVADTPEVQAAKAAFFQSFQRQVAAAAPAVPVWG